MEILKPDNLDRVVEILKNGGVIIYPTETTYGIGCDATNQEAVSRIFQIKGRTPDKPFLVVMPNVGMAKKYLVWNKNLEKLSDKYWPGAVTVIGKAKNDFLVAGVVSQEKTLAVRVTRFAWLQKLFAQFCHPLVSTSANLSGSSEVYDPEHLIKIFANQKHTPDAIVVAGVLPIVPPSTLVDTTGPELKILRQGEVIIEI